MASGTGAERVRGGTGPRRVWDRWKAFCRVSTVRRTAWPSRLMPVAPRCLVPVALNAASRHGIVLIQNLGFGTRQREHPCWQRENVDGVCQGCSTHGRPDHEASVHWPEYEADRVVPHSKGGPAEICNAQVLCRTHNPTTRSVFLVEGRAPPRYLAVSLYTRAHASTHHRAGELICPRSSTRSASVARSFSACSKLMA